MQQIVWSMQWYTWGLLFHKSLIKLWDNIMTIITEVKVWDGLNRKSFLDHSKLHLLWYEVNGSTVSITK